MAYVSSDLPLYSADRPRQVLANPLAALFYAVADGLRKRWTYQRTLLSLQGYTERNLDDIGADQGAREFARRAAGL